MTVTVVQAGGSGGAGTNGANGGAGAGSSASSLVTGRTEAGSLYLTQAADGGNGGDSAGGAAGAGGAATSVVTFDDTKNATQSDNEQRRPRTPLVVSEGTVRAGPLAPKAAPRWPRSL